MGRGRGKGKKQSAIATRDDNGSGEDEKLPVRRRGRPLKPMKDEIEEEDEVEKIGGEVEDGEETKSKKRKRPSLIKVSADSVTEEDSIGTKSNATVLIKPVGYRQNGSRRKNKPRRAAEVGVECRWILDSFSWVHVFAANAFWEIPRIN